MGTAIIDFNNWLARWQQSHTSESQAALLAQGLILAEQRHHRMRSLMRSDPDTALAMAVSYHDYALLPEPIKGRIEEPFSTSGTLDVQISCGRGHKSDMHYSFEDSARQRWDLHMPRQPRVIQSKRGLPVQGIRLGSAAVVRGSVFQILHDADARYVQQHWPSGQGAAQHCYATGQLIEGKGLTAVAGGRVFRFQDEVALQSVETALQEADRRPGMDVGSQWILRRTLSDGFPFDAFTLETETAAFASTTGPKTAFFIRVDFPDLAGDPIAAATLEQIIDLDVNDALGEYSYGLTSMDAEVSATTYRLVSDSTEYLSTKDENDIYDEALAAFIDAGNEDPRSSYDTVGVYFPEIGFSWAGIASVGGQKMWLDGNSNPEVILHEFGHNYGLSHANYWIHDHTNPNSIDPVDPTGDNEEYGDPTDVMGDGTIEEGHFHVAGKQQLGWLEGNQWQDLSSSADNGSYRVYRFDDAAATGLQALRIAKSATGEHYWLSYRKAHNNLISYRRGAYLIWEQAENADRNQSWLIDTTPGSAEGKEDAPLRLGHTYADSASEVYITVTAVSESDSDEYLDAVVNFGPFAGNSAPTATLSGQLTATARQAVLFSVDAIDADGDTLAYAWDFGDGSVTSNTAGVTHSWAVGGTYAVSVTISDMKGGSTTVSQSVTVTDPLQSWTDRSSGASEDLNAVAASDTIVIAVGDSPPAEVGSIARILRSTDGSIWTNHSPSGNVQNLHCKDVIWDGSEFLIAGYDYDFELSSPGWEGVVYTSPDGQTWTRAYETDLADSRFDRIASNGSGIVVVIGRDGTVARRSEGSWSIVDPGVPATQRIKDIAYGDGSFVLVGHNYSDSLDPAYNGNVVIKRSSDGLAWSDASSATGLDSWKDLRRIHYTGSEFLASGFYARVLQSNDAGQTWNSPLNGDNYELEAFSTGNGIDYGIGINYSNSEAYVDLMTTDGSTWTELTPSTAEQRNGITYFNNTFITVGDNGTIQQTDSLPEATDFSAYISSYYTGTDSDGTANPDGDWANNLIEYALGSEPNNSGSTPGAPSFSINETNHLVFELSRAQRRADIAYSVWWSTDLIDWTQTGLIIEIDTDSTLKVRSSDTADAQQKAFFKLQLTQP
jgi:hypothetical protein